MNPEPSVSPWNIITRFTCKKKFKPQVSAGKLMATVFWDADGVIHMDFLEPGTTTNPKRYIATLKTLKQFTISGHVDT
jgi:hypothetical protein